MRLIFTIALLAGGGLAWLMAAPPAQAQSGASNSTTTRTTTARPRTRVIVRGRSYLDPGRTVMPYSRQDNDYVFLGRRPMDALGPGGNLDREPINSSWELGSGWRTR